MFKEKTVIILGAGASVDSGYPTGEELINEIISLAIVSKERLLRCVFNEVEGEKKYKISNSVVERLEANGYIDEKKSPTQLFKSSSRNDMNFRNNFDSLCFERGYDVWQVCRKACKEEDDLKKLVLEEVREFQKALKQSMPLSIDTFLSKRRSLREIGKALISYVILSKENGDITTAQENDGKHWYRFLQDAIITGFEPPEYILENKLTIITFNYDLSLEYYLYDTLDKIEYFKQEDKDYVREFLKDLNIIHIYGQLGYVDWHKDKCEELYYKVVAKKDFEIIVEKEQCDDLWNELKNKGYINKNGFVSKELLSVIEDSAKNLSQRFRGKKTEIVDLLKEKLNMGIDNNYIREHNEYGDIRILDKFNEYKDLIRTIGGEKSKIEYPFIGRAIELLKEADNVFILGFDLYEDNIDLLKIGEIFSSTVDCNGLKKKIYYTNYNDRQKIERRLNSILAVGLGKDHKDVKKFVEERRHKFVVKSSKDLYRAVLDDFDLG